MTVLAAAALAAHEPPPPSKTARVRAVNEAVEQVSIYLSNTPRGLPRVLHIDPRIIDRFDSGETIRQALDRAVDRSDPGEFPDRERIERAVIRLID